MVNTVTDRRDIFMELPDRKPVSQEQVQALLKRLNEHAGNNFLYSREEKQPETLTQEHLLAWNVVKEIKGQLHPTASFQLLEGISDEFQNSMIRCACFKGTVRAVFIDHRDFTGPVDEQVEYALQFVLRHIRLGSRFESIIRQDFFELPEDTLREIIASAVCCRSFYDSGKIFCCVFDDRVEITFPGKPDPLLTMEELKSGSNIIRNKSIAKVFDWMHLLHLQNQWIPEVFRASEQYGLKEPELRYIGNSIRISMYRRDFEFDSYGAMNPEKYLLDQKYHMDDVDHTVMELIARHPEYSAAEIAEET